jgi:N-acetylmuramoyl-L-alanine amidase
MYYICSKWIEYIAEMFTKRYSSLLVLLFFISSVVLANESNFLQHLTTKAERGDGVYKLLKRYDLFGYSCNLESFYEINKLEQNAGLIVGKKYALPIKLYKYNGKSIRSTIGRDDWDLAKRIAAYNRSLRDKSLKPKYYLEDKIVAIPFHLLNCPEAKVETTVSAEPEKTTEPEKTYIYSDLFGGKNRAEKKSDKLKGNVFYIMSGHGGPDPGAIGTKASNTMCEDEYAYDVCLRLARNLMQHGAKVHMIIQDKNDGIREDHYLDCDKDEVCLGNKEIPLRQIERLRQRTDATNRLYKKEKQNGGKHQVIAVHVDSRHAHSRQDVFFYHCPKSESGLKMANQIHDTFKQKYKIHRANGQYHGTVSSRGLYVLRHTHPPAVYVELANIKNSRDQTRIILPSNRQALADWLFEGMTKMEP